MRLLQLDGRGELSLTKDLHDNIPPYGILSHTWGADHDEVTFEDLRDGLGKSKAGYAKILFCEQQARKDGLQYIWVDTCCIHKANLTELSEAINSMFSWYRKAEKCYVYLSDVSARKRDNGGQTQRAWESAFRNSAWFTRGWTLQELLAPTSVQFFSREGQLLGSKRTLDVQIQEITGIHISALRGASLADFRFDELMRWTKNRNTKLKEDKVYCLLGIFAVSMSILYGEGEENAMARMTEKISRSNSNRLYNIGQGFVSSNSNGLDSCSNNFTSITTRTQNMSLSDRRKQLLTSLSFDQMDSRWSNIKGAYSTTCEWLLKHPVYMEWLDPTRLHQHHGFLWISGKPGAGKSTIVKFAHGSAERKRLHKEIVVSFFFNARGDELERSIIGMYRSLLFQLLTKAADLQATLDDFSLSSEFQSECPTWTIKLLHKLLSAAIAKLEQRQMKCFIDALDECDEQQIQEMVNFFEELGQNALQQGTQIFICFSSRHYPTIDIANGRQLILENESGHGEDLKKYVERYLRAGEGEYLEEIRGIVLEKANGVFIWAVLVIDILNKELLGGRIFAVKKRLREIPEKLSYLFKDILTRDCVNMTDLLLCLQWILFAKRPLRREEFYFAMVSGLDPDLDNIAEWNPKRITEEDMNRFVLNSSKGLAELTKSKWATVQFIHESVRDFLIKDGGLYELWPELGRDLYSSSHDRLKQCCQNYLTVDLSGHLPSDNTLPKASSDSAKDLRRRVTTKFPFLEYASQYILCHANEAAKEMEQDTFLKGFALEPWLSITNLIEGFEIRRHTLNASLLYLFAEMNYARLIKTIYPHSSTLNVRGERYHYPLFAALVNGHQDAVRALLQLDENVSVEDFMTHRDFGRNIWLRKDQTQLLWAIEREHKTLSEMLLNSTDIELHSCNREGRNALFLAAAKGYERVVYLLLEKGANIEATDKYGNTVLSRAVGFECEQTVPPLLGRGANVDATYNIQGTALINATTGGNMDIIQLLIDRGANLEVTNLVGCTPLLVAAKSGKEKLVLLLLDKGANIEATNQAKCTALFVAAENQHDRTAQLLLNRGANFGARDSITLLPWAAQCGYIGIVKVLLYKGTSIETTNSTGITALLGAVRGSQKDIVQLLLDKGANIEAVDKNGRTPLSHASENRDQQITQLLLAHNASVAPEDKNGKTPLLWVMGEFQHPLGGRQRALSHYDRQLRFLLQQNKNGEMFASGRKEITPGEMIQLLLARGANINTAESNGSTPLILAVQRRWKDAVQTIINNFANVDIADRNGRTALIYAASWGASTIIEILLNNNANINVADLGGKTALIYAAYRGEITSVEILLNNNANINVADLDGKTALTHATRNDHRQVRKLLLARGAK